MRLRAIPIEPQQTLCNSLSVGAEQRWYWPWWVNWSSCVKTLDCPFNLSLPVSLLQPTQRSQRSVRTLHMTSSSEWWTIKLKCESDRFIHWSTRQTHTTDPGTNPASLTEDGPVSSTSGPTQISWSETERQLFECFWFCLFRECCCRGSKTLVSKVTRN